MPEKTTFHDYMRQYAEDHQNPINKACHMIGIPLIVGSLPVIPFSPPVGLGMFGTGWTFQFVGHFFEGKKPAFLDDLRGLLDGPLFLVAEIAFKLGLSPELRAEVEDRAGPTRWGALATA